MESIIFGIVLNIWSWNNADFFVARKNNERLYECRWEKVEWQKTDYKNPSVNLFGYVRYKHRCIDKDKY
mgnify:FL=1